MERLIVVSALLCALLIPGPVQSEEMSGPSCSLDNLTGPIVENDSTEGPDDDSGNLNLGGISTLNGILGVGQSLRDGLNRTTATQKKSVETQTAFLRSLMVHVGQEREKAENQRVFGERAGTYNADDGFSPGVMQGLSTEDNVSGNLRSSYKQHQHEFDEPSQRRDWLLALPDMREGKIFASNDTLSAEEMSDAQKKTKTMLDPIPTINTQEEFEDSSTGRDRGSIRKVKDARLLVPGGIMADLIAQRSPSMNLEDWAGLLEEKSGHAPETVDGKISSEALLKAISEMRFANQDWLSGDRGIHGKTQAGVLREILQSRIDSLMVEYRQMRWMDRMTAAMVQEQASRLENLDKKIEETKEKVR